MKSQLMGVIAVLGLLWAAGNVVPEASAQEPMLRPAEYVLANGANLDPGAHAIPCVCDWNNDGRKDLVVGYRYDDKVALYLNQGTDSQPVFTGFTNIQANGVDIYHLGTGCGAPAPWVCDYDSDGKKDLLVGTGTEGYVYFYKNTKTDAEPALAGGVLLTVGGATLSVGARATPYVHDWDEDGLNDLLCGDVNGKVHFFKNVGTAQSPLYASDSLIQAGGVSVQFGMRSAVRVHDWDGDGLKDLLGSGSNTAAWCKNIGTNAAPSLNAPQRLRSPQQGLGLTNIDTGYRMRLEVVDWNDDGVTDLLIGDDEGYVFYYEGYRFAFAAVEAQGGGQIAIRWDSADYLLYDVLAGGALDSLSPIATKLPSGGKMTEWTDTPTERAKYYKVRVAQ